MNNRNLLFWQPKRDYLRLLNGTMVGKVTVIILNYIIWFYLFYLAYLLIRSNTNFFWQILVATVIGEVVEKYGKSHALWRRPLYSRNDATPAGLVDRWYKTGSFPSGHTIKATFFYLFIITSGIYSPLRYLITVVPLLTFRIVIGFHYPIDMLAGVVIGAVIWSVSSNIVAPDFLTQFVRVIFNFVFRIS